MYLDLLLQQDIKKLFSQKDIAVHFIKTMLGNNKRGELYTASECHLKCFNSHLQKRSRGHKQLFFSSKSLKKYHLLQLL
jgi:hypothetical protein